jgi:hypothetical protein
MDQKIAVCNEQAIQMEHISDICIYGTITVVSALAMAVKIYGEWSKAHGDGATQSSCDGNVVA